MFPLGSLRYLRCYLEEGVGFPYVNFVLDWSSDLLQALLVYLIVVPLTEESQYPGPLSQRFKYFEGRRDGPAVQIISQRHHAK